MTNWQQMTTAEREAWLQAHVGKQIAYIDTAAVTATQQPDSPRFAAAWKTGEIREWDVALGRGVLLDDEFWIPLKALADVGETAPMEKTPGPSKGVQHYSQCKDDIRAVIQSSVDVLEDLIRWQYEAHVDDDIAANFAEVTLRSLINLGYTRADLMQAWDAQH